MVKVFPHGSPNPVITFTTPFGIFVFSINFANSNIVAGANSDDLITTVFPIAKAGASLTAVNNICEFHGMIAAITRIPVIGVPIETKKLKGLDSLLSIVQMPKGIPVGTVAIGKDGAINAALFAASIISVTDSKVRKNLNILRNKQTRSVKKKPR